MALNWDCSLSKTCDDVGRARYTIPVDGKATRPRDDGDVDLAALMSRSQSPNKVQFGFQRGTGSDRRNTGPREGMSAQDVCSYPASVFGPPQRVREGKLGGSWRHLRETQGVRGNCLMFLEGDVKTRDNCRAATECLERHGIPSFHEERPPKPPALQLPPYTSLKPNLIRAPRTKALDSIFAEHARDGFVYWFDNRIKGGGCVRQHKRYLDEEGWNKYFIHG